MDKPNLSGLWNPEKGTKTSPSDELMSELVVTVGNLNAKIDSLTNQIARMDELLKIQNRKEMKP